MKRDIRQPHSDPARNDSTRLEGLIDFGMGRDALRLAAEILDKRSPRPEEIGAALRAIGVHAGKMKTWKGRVENMVARIPKRTRHAARESLLMYFASIGEHKRAAEFAVSTRRFAPEALYMAVETLIELRRFEDAYEAVKSSPEFMRDHDENEYLCEAFAAASSANGDHWIAMLDRLNSPAGGALARNLVEGAVESAFALVIYQFDRRLEGIEAIRAEGFDPTQITVPGNHEALLSAEEKLCLRWRAKLLKMIPKDRRFRYALEK